MARQADASRYYYYNCVYSDARCRSTALFFRTEIEKLRKSGGVDSDSMLDEIENGRALRQRRSTDFFARRTMPSASDGPAASGCVSRRIFPIDDDSNQSLPAKRQLAVR